MSSEEEMVLLSHDSKTSSPPVPIEMEDVEVGGNLVIYCLTRVSDSSKLDADVGVCW